VEAVNEHLASLTAKDWENERKDHASSIRRVARIGIDAMLEAATQPTAVEESLKVGEAVVDDTSTLEEWLKREMPSGTVISDPSWWAKRIASHAIYSRPKRDAVDSGAIANSESSGDDESVSEFTPAHSNWERRQVFTPSFVGSWPWLRGCINAIPKREEFIGGQREKYVKLDEVIGWIDEGERRAMCSEKYTSSYAADAVVSELKSLAACAIRADILKPGAMVVLVEQIELAAMAAGRGETG
jgi:hypothetical protein